MAYPDDPTGLKDFINERELGSYNAISDEEHDVTSGTTFNLEEVPYTEDTVTIIGDTYGSLTPSFTDASPPAGTAYFNPLNTSVTLNAANSPDRYLVSYSGRGTANDEASLEASQTALISAYIRALFGWVAATATPSQTISAKKANFESTSGKLVDFAGGNLDLSGITFNDTGYTKQLRIVVTDAGALNYSEGLEGANKAACESLHPSIYPSSTTIAKVYLTHNAVVSSTNIFNVAPGTNFGSTGDPHHDDDDKYTYKAGTTSGGLVRIKSAMYVEFTDGSDESLGKVPGYGFVTNILNATYCTVKRTGIIDLSGTTISYGALTPGAMCYMHTTSDGYITQTEPTEAGTYWQPVGIAVSTSSIDVNCTSTGHWIIQGDDKKPGQWKYNVGVGHGEFVCIDKAAPDTVDEAKSDSKTTMDAIGVVIADPGATYCQVMGTDYIWINSEHGDARPSGVTNIFIGQVFYISSTTEGQATASVSIESTTTLQSACVQLDTNGTKYRMLCGASSSTGKRPEPEDPDDAFDYPWDGVGSNGDAMCLTPASVATQTDATDDAKVSPQGIMIANNTTNRCSLVCPRNIYDKDGTYSNGEYILNSATKGAYALRSSTIIPIGSWLVRIGFGRGSTVKGLQVDIKNYGKVGDPGADDNDGGGGSGGVVDGTRDPKPSRIVGHYYSGTKLAAGTPVEAYWSGGYNMVCSTNWNNANPCKGIVLDAEYEIGTLLWKTTVLMYGPYGSGYTPSAKYFAVLVGTLGTKIALGKYAKAMGVGLPDGQLMVSPEPVSYVDPGTGDPTPLMDYVELLDPTPLNNPYDKMRDWDDSTSSSKRSTNWVSKNILCELPTVAANVHFHADSVGVGTGAYALLDLCRLSDGASVLTTKAKLIGIAGAPRGNTLTEDTTYGTTAGHVAAVIDPTKLPLDPGDALYWKVTIDDGAAFSTDPYGFGIIINKYGVRG